MTFTAAAVLRAVDEGTLDLDRPIETWIGRELWFPRLPNARTLTMRQLLSHRSGVPDLAGSDAILEAMTTDVDKRWTSAELVAFVLDQRPRSRAGSRYLYSAMNYVIAGAVYERAVGRPLFSDITRLLIDPSALSATSPAERRDFERLASGQLDTGDARYGRYGLGSTTLRGDALVYNLQFEYAAGGLISTSHDLARWATRLWTGQVFSAARLAEMLDGRPSERDARYGLGTKILTSTRGPIYVHDGHVFGYQTTVFRLPDQKLSAAIQVNADPLGRFTMAPDVCLGQLVAWVLRQER
jgi:D-alanyl-D-alanine carboxypeptidase